MSNDRETYEVTKQMRRAGQLFVQVTKLVEGEDGAAALSAICYALIACAKSIGVTREQVIHSVEQSWNVQLPGATGKAET